jgi:hypothetical protein
VAASAESTGVCSIRSVRDGGIDRVAESSARIKGEPIPSNLDPIPPLEPHRWREHRAKNRKKVAAGAVHPPHRRSMRRH